MWLFHPGTPHPGQSSKSKEWAQESSFLEIYIRWWSQTSCLSYTRSSPEQCITWVRKQVMCRNFCQGFIWASSEVVLRIDPTCQAHFWQIIRAFYLIDERPGTSDGVFDFASKLLLKVFYYAFVCCCYFYPTSSMICSGRSYLVIRC